MSINLNKFRIYFNNTIIILALIPLFILICSAKSLEKDISKKHIIYIQPLGNVDSECLNFLKKSVEDFYGYKCSIKTKLELSNDIISNSKTRYDEAYIIR